MGCKQCTKLGGGGGGSTGEYPPSVLPVINLALQIHAH